MNPYSYQPSDAAVEQIATLPWYTEGPVVDAQGNIYVTTLTGGTILKSGENGQFTPWAKGNCPNGQIIGANGDHLVCDSGNSSVSRYAPDGQWLGFDIKGTCASVVVQKPNDLVTDSTGGIYFTDSVRQQGRLFYYHPRTGEQHLLASGLDFPNGLALHPKGAYLYIAESYKNRLLIMDLTRHTWEVFCELPQHASGNMIDNLPDGLATDPAGNIWVAHYGMGCMQVISATGLLLRSCTVPFRTPSNCYFHKHSLIVTGGHNEAGPGGILKLNCYE